MDLFKHQKGMLEKLEKYPYCLNGSEAGTGKTFPSIRFTEKKGELTLIVAPAFLCYNWLSEIHRFSNLEANIFDGKNFGLWGKNSPVLITSYNRLTVVEKLINARGIKVELIIADECHYLCNVKSQRTKAFHTLIMKKMPNYLQLLTGTAMRNRIPELYSLLALISYKYPQRGFFEKFPRQMTFSETFSNRVPVYAGPRQFFKYEGYKNLKALKLWLKPFYFRYKLSEIENLPALMKQKFYLDPKTCEDTVLDEKMTKLWTDKVASGHTSSIKLANALLKAPHTVEFIEHQLKSGINPIVGFTDHLASVKLIYEKLATKVKIRVITGATPMKERKSIVEQFQNGKIEVLVGTIGAMGTGITLTKSNLAIFNDRSWVPADNMQAEKRIHRLSQERACVIVDIVRDGIDSNIVKQLNEKIETISAVL